MWLVLLLYLVIAVGVETALRFAGVGTAGIVLAGFAIAVLVGMEAATLRRFTLRRRGFRDIGIVSGEDREDAERRFFDSWVRAGRKNAAHRRPRRAVRRCRRRRSSYPPDIVGLFPDPGANR